MGLSLPLKKGEFLLIYLLTNNLDYSGKEQGIHFARLRYIEG
jgi:hypothetical protein